MKKLQFIAIFFLISIIIWSCEKDEEVGDTIINVIEPTENAVLKFEPSTTSWFFRQYPDSITININDGLPPYIISQRSDNVQAKIVGNQLILYPYFIYGNNSLYDFILIRDNAGNENSFNFNIESLRNFYDFNNSDLNVNVSGSQNLSFNGPAYGSLELDKYSKTLRVDVTESNQSYYFFLNNVDRAGTHRLNENNVLVREFFSLSFRDSLNYTRNAQLSDTNQVINITTFSDSLIELNFDVDLLETQWNATFSHKITGSMILRK